MGNSMKGEAPAETSVWSMTTTGNPFQPHTSPFVIFNDSGQPKSQLYSTFEVLHSFQGQPLLKNEVQLEARKNILPEVSEEGKALPNLQLSLQQCVEKGRETVRNLEESKREINTKLSLSLSLSLPIATSTNQGQTREEEKEIGGVMAVNLSHFRLST